MIDSKIWKFLKEEIEKNNKAVILIVVESKGSSPGRVGFKLALAKDGSFVGTIGGGAVEHNLISESQKLLLADSRSPVVRKQIHNEDKANSSGMICSGEQTVVIYPLCKPNLSVINECLTACESLNKTHFVITSDSFKYSDVTLKPNNHYFSFVDENNWSYKENLHKLETVHIFGAGHVCYALSELLRKLGFYIIIYDDRKDFVMMNNNIYAHEKFVINYRTINEQIEGKEEDYYLIMTHSHLNDAEVLAQLINKTHKYLGMMGSPSKVKEIYGQLEDEGIPKEKLLKVNAPIGIPINSKTADEIAVSIAAELIKVRNG